MRAVLGGLSYAGTELALCTILQITQRDGVVLSLTDHDQDLTIGSTFRAAGGYELSSLRTSVAIEEDAFVIEGLLNTLFGPTEVNALIGLLSGARVDVFEVNTLNLSQYMALKRGRITKVSPKGTFLSLEVEGLSGSLLRHKVTEVYSPTCLADLGDARCGASFSTYPGVITSVPTATSIVASGFGGPATAGWFTNGKMVLAELAWAPNRIKSYDHPTRTFVLDRPLPLLAGVPTVGGAFTAHQGCDLRPSTCKNTFNNLVNFRGHPFIPDKDRAKKDMVLTAGGGYVAGDT